MQKTLTDDQIDEMFAESARLGRELDRIGLEDAIAAMPASQAVIAVRKGFLKAYPEERAYELMRMIADG